MKNKKFFYIALSFIILFCYVGMAYRVRKQNDTIYMKAKVYIEDESYEEAIQCLEKIGDYKDAKIVLEDAKEKAIVKETYETGNVCLYNEDYSNAIDNFESVIDYKDSAEKVKEASYYLALSYMEENNNDEAKEFFIKADGYEDSVFYLSKLEIMTSEDAKKNIYEKALQKYAEDEYEDAIELFEMIEDYEDSKEYIEECKLGIKRVNNNNVLAAGIRTSFAVTNTNRVNAVGNNMAGQCNVDKWEEIVSVDSYDYFTIGLRKDRKVSVTGVCDGFDFNEANNWENIIDIAAGEQFIMGLAENGKVYVETTNASRNIRTEDWENVVAIDAGWNFAVGLTKDKELLFTGKFDTQFEEYEEEKDEWKNVVNISSGGGGNLSACRGKGHTVGLRKDGTVVAVGANDYGQCDVDDWTDMIKVVAGDWFTVGLQSGGKVFITGSNRPGTAYIEREVLESCFDIVDISAGFGHTMCLKKDGTVVAFGFNDDGKCEETREWNDILVP